LVTFAFIHVLVLITKKNIFKVVPHITNAIQEWIERVAMIPVDGKEGPADVCVIELGGTIGGMR
jgi:CTP synthase (UTP-ammonia lyase)